MKKVKKSPTSHSFVLAAIAVVTLLIASVVIGVAAMRTSTDSRSQASEEIQKGPMVYRLIHEQTGNVVMTADKSELNKMIKEQNYKFQQALFWSVAQNTPGAAGVYRLYNTTTNTHAYAIDPLYRRELVKKGFRVEGISFFALYPQDTNGTLVTRFFNKSTKRYDHRLTDEIKREGYESEGGAFRVINIGWPR